MTNRFLGVFVGLALVAGTASAQTPAALTPAPSAEATAAKAAPAAPKAPAAPVARQAVPGEAAVDPVNCSWRTDKSAVVVGERFTLTLTCAVVETEHDKAVIDTNQLDASALSLSPFDIVSAVHHEDVVASPWRYFQYEYTLRVIGNAFFGLDVDIPSLNLKYNMVAQGGDGAGRERMYILPALPVRVLSLVPAKETDIRDTSTETFANREARTRRASGEVLAATIAFGFAVVLLGLAVVRAIGQYRGRTRTTERLLLSPFGVLGACLSAARRVRKDVAGEGWTQEHAARALAILRVGAAVALGRTVSQAPATAGAKPREGQVPAHTGLVRRKHLMLSAAASPRLVGKVLADTEGTRRPSGVANVLESLQPALEAFSTARYGRALELDSSALDNALEAGVSAIRRLRVKNVWPLRLAGTVVKVAAAVGVAVWLR